MSSSAGSISVVEAHSHWAFPYRSHSTALSILTMSNGNRTRAGHGVKEPGSVIGLPIRVGGPGAVMVVAGNVESSSAMAAEELRDL